MHIFSRRDIPFAIITACFVFVLPAEAQNSPSQSSNPGANQSQPTTVPSDLELAMEQRNPIADLIEVPIVSTFDFGIPAGNGFQYTLTIQPTIPFTISRDWILITKPNFSILSSPESASGQGRTNGSSDLVTEFYFSPQKSTGVIWGFGPVIGIPTASNSLLGTGKWTLGPGLAIIKQTEHWTFGAKINHVWSFAGDKNRAEVSDTLLEPILAYSWGKGWTVGLDLASTYDSNAASHSRWAAPVEISISKVVDFGARPVSLSFGVIPYAVAPVGSPRVGFSFTVDPLFPKE